MPGSRTARPFTERKTRRVAVPTSAGRSTRPGDVRRAAHVVDVEQTFGERAAVHRGEPIAQRRARRQRKHRSSVVRQRDAHVAPRERHRRDDVENGAPLGARAAEELEPRRRVVEQARRAHGRAAAPRGRVDVDDSCRRRRARAFRRRRRARSRARAATPSRSRPAPRRETRSCARRRGPAPSESSTSRAARARARRRRAIMPVPSSLTRIVCRPPSSIATSIACAPASSAFSISSLTTDAGRSTTSPAAIWSATALGRTAMRGGEATVTAPKLRARRAAASIAADLRRVSRIEGNERRRSRSSRRVRRRGGRASTRPVGRSRARPRR